MLVVVAVLAGALAQAVGGIGFNLVCAPALIAELGAPLGVGRALLLSALLNAVILARNLRSVLWRQMMPLAAAAVAATPLFIPATRKMDPDVLRISAGVAVLLGVVLTWRHAIRARGTAAAVIAGVISAGMNVIASASGPAAAIYADSAGWDRARTRVTLQAYFLIVNVTALIGLPAGRSSSHGLFPQLIALLTGTLAGDLLAHRVSTARARALTLVLAAASAIALVLSVALKHQ